MGNDHNRFMSDRVEPSQSSGSSQISVLDKDRNEICSTMVWPGTYTMETAAHTNVTPTFTITSSAGSEVVTGDDPDPPFYLMVDRVEKKKMNMREKYTFTVE